MAERGRSNTTYRPSMLARMQLAAYQGAGTFALKRFERRTADATGTNRNTLNAILKLQRNTRFGREHRFEAIRKSADPENVFREAVPLSRYADYREYIQHIATGQARILTRDSIDIFAGSAGTSSEGKRLPSTRRARRKFMFFVPLVQQGVISREIGHSLPAHRGINLMSLYSPEPEDGSKQSVTSANNAAMKSLQRQIPLLWLSPAAVFDISHQPTAWYLHALFGLQSRDASHITAIFASHVTSFFSLIEKHQLQLLKDIQTGRLSAHLSLSDSRRYAIERQLLPNEQRAGELRTLFEAGFEGIAARIWPRMNYIATITTGSFATYLPRLRSRIGPELPIYSPCHAASEGIIGINLNPRSDDYVLALGGAHYEFIPLTNLPGADAEPIGIEKLEVGREYEIVLTTFAGLYRYRIDDVIRVTGFHGTTPMFRFLGRKSAILNLVGEKTTEQHTSLALSTCIREWLGSGRKLHDYSVTVRNHKALPSYAFYVELQSGIRATGENSGGVARRLDAALCKSNAYYWCNGRKAEALGPVTIKFVETGTFDALTRMRDETSGRRVSSQLKTPRIVNRNEHLQLLDAAVYLTTSGQSADF